MQGEDAGARKPGLAGILAVLAILSTAAAIDLPWIRAPFGPNEINSSSYFGPFAQTYARFGFRAVRGIPVAAYGLASLSEGVPYLNHPPAVAWLSGLWGTAEWQVRLPFAIGQALAGCVLCLVLSRRFGILRASLAGCILVTLPVFAFYGRTIFDAFTVPFGLACVGLFDAATRATGRGRARLAALLFLSAFAGIWMDWPFAFWIGALAVFLPGPRFRANLLLLIGAGVSMLAGAGSILLWQKWATSNPDLPFGLPPPQGSIVLAILRDRPPLPELARDLAQRFAECFSLPALAAAALGLVPLFRRAPRIASACLLAGIVHVGIFARHAQSHPTFSSDFGPLVAAAACSVPALPGRFGRLLPLAIALVALAGSASTTVARLREADTPLLRDIGKTLDELSADVRSDGSIARIYRVRHNLPYDFQYYIRSPVTLPHFNALADVRRELETPSPHGLRYLRFDVETGSPEIAWSFRIEPALAEWLGRHPSRAIPALRQTASIPGAFTTVRITDCRAYDLKE